MAEKWTQPEDVEIDAGIWRYACWVTFSGIHVIVENQIADDNLPVRRTAQRLTSEGLDRHEAIHAIGSVLAGHLNNLMQQAGADRPDEGNSAANSNEAYFSELERLTAEGWLRSA